MLDFINPFIVYRQPGNVIISRNSVLKIFALCRKKIEDEMSFNSYVRFANSFLASAVAIAPDHYNKSNFISVQEFLY